MASLLDSVLTPEQQLLLLEHLQSRLEAGFGDVMIRVERHQVRRIGQMFFDNATPDELADRSALTPIVPHSPVQRRRR